MEKKEENPYFLSFCWNTYLRLNKFIQFYSFLNI